MFVEHQQLKNETLWTWGWLEEIQKASDQVIVQDWSRSQVKLNQGDLKAKKKHKKEKTIQVKF